MPKIIIQGIECSYRDEFEDEEILYADLPQDEQYFKRVEDPFQDEDQLVEIASVDYESRKSKYNKIQLEWVEREEKRMTYGQGVYAMINGVKTYIPASYWGYVNHWTLERGDKPDYREADRIFFLFMEYLCFETDVLGLTRGKGRRQGATSLGFYWMWWICGRTEEKIGGSISFNEDAANKNFSGMFMRGFKDMNPCFVRDFDSASEKFVRFVKPVEKAKRGVIKKRQGLNSRVDVLPTTINSYDSGMVNFGLFDEPGKYDKMDINTYWSKVSPTLKIGRNKVGFAYMPTTVNPKENGGENYRKYWNDANQNAINPDTHQPYGLKTPHKVIRYFVPATEGYAGCIDKFGASVIEDPIEPIMGNDGKLITEGARTVILKDRELKRGEQKMEHRRDFPLDEFDMFAVESGACEFNEERLIARIRYLESNPVIWRQIRLYEVIEKIENPITRVVTDKLVIKWMDDPKGDWFLLEEPMKPNNFVKRGTYEPLSTTHYKIGVDTYKNIFAIEGSEGAACIFKNSTIENGEEKGLYPVLIFVGRPHLIKQFNREIFKACLWYGCKANFELDAGSWFYEDFHEWEATRLLEWTPVRPYDAHKNRTIIKPGTESAVPFQLAKQLEVAKIYFDGDNPSIYNGNIERTSCLPLLKQALDYNHSERTPYHLVVAFMLSLMPIFGVNKKPVSSKPKQLMPTYKIEKYA